MLGIIAGLVVGGGRVKQCNRALDLNVTNADLMKWKVGMLHLPPQPSQTPPLRFRKGQSGNLGEQVRERRVKDVCVYECGGWRHGGGVLTFQCHVSAAQQQAHPSVLMQAGTCGNVRGGSGGEVFATPTWCSLRCVEKVRVGVMVMQRLMEMSCRDYVGLRSWLPSRSVDRDHCCNTKALAAVLPNKQNNNLDAGGFKA